MSKEPGSTSWIIRCPADFVESDLSDRDFRLMLILEARARNNPHIWYGNEGLGQALGKGERTLQEGLNSLEEQGWIKRLFADAKKRKRLAIIMRRRVDPKRPAAHTPEILAAVEAIIRERRNMHEATAEICILCAQKPAPEEGTESIKYEDEKADLALASPSRVVEFITLSGKNHQAHGKVKKAKAEPLPATPVDEQLASYLNAIEALPQNKRKTWVNKVAYLLSRYYEDQHSLDRYRLELWKIAKNELPPTVISNAFKQTEGARSLGQIMRGGSESATGAYFFGCLKQFATDVRISEELENQPAMQGYLERGSIREDW